MAMRLELGDVDFFAGRAVMLLLAAAGAAPLGLEKAALAARQSSLMLIAAPQVILAISSSL